MPGDVKVEATLKIIGIGLALLGVLVAFSLAWRLASRRWSILCPAFLE